MASDGHNSGDTNGLRTSEVRNPFVSPEIMPVDVTASSLAIYATTPLHSTLETAQPDRHGPVGRVSLASSGSGPLGPGVRPA
ncbi:MAG: hypothetical protein V3Q69_06290 [Burkholderia sp.]